MSVYRYRYRYIPERRPHAAPSVGVYVGARNRTEPSALSRAQIVGPASGASSGQSSSGGAASASVLELSNQFYSLIPHVSTDESGNVNRLKVSYISLT